MALLELRGVTKTFGGVAANVDISFDVAEGEILGLIGPNGAGKTSLFNSISGEVMPDRGAIHLAGRQISGTGPVACALAGVARTFQVVRSFDSMTVLENVMVGAERPGNDVAGQPSAVVERALAALSFVGLRADANRMVGTLSYGHQRYVEIARALASSPGIVLLDEPAAGLNPTEKRELGVLLQRLKGHGLTILIVDHDMALVEQVADHITVLNFGRRIADGRPADVLSHPDVIAAYLGEPRSDAAA